MKDLIVILIIVGIVFGGSFALGIHFENSGNEVLEVLQKMSDGLVTDSQSEKNERIGELKNIWDEKQRVWILFQYHENINSMEDVLIECCNYYKKSNEEEFNISYEKLKRSIEDLKNREDISMLNIM